MFLKRVKEISTADAARLRAAKTKNQALLTLADANFLCDTLIGQEENFQAKDGEIKVVAKAIGEFSQPEFGLVKDFFYGEAYRRILSQEGKETLFLEIGPSAAGPGVNFGLRNGNDPRYKFSSGTFFDRKYDNKKYVLDGVILRIANYFQDKPALYAAIQQTLLQNKEAYSSVTSKAFIEALLGLFSVEYAFEAKPIFEISPYKGEKVFLTRKTVRKAWFYLGKEFFHPKKEVERFWCKPELQTELWLKGNQLIFITSWIGWSDCYDETFRNKVADPEFEQFLEENLQDWLQRLVASADFGMSICEQVKTKILFASL